MTRRDRLCGLQIAGNALLFTVLAAIAGGAALQGQYALALAFVNPSTDAQAVLDQVCGAAIETGECSR